MSRMAVASSLAFSGATLVTLGVEPREYRADDAERRRRGEIQQVAVTIHERLGVVIDVFGRALVCDNEGVLVGVRRFDPGREAIRQRELGLVFVDRAREFSGGRRRHPGLRDQQPLQPDGTEIVIGNRGAEDSMPVASVSSEIAGSRLASAFASSMAFRVNPPRLAYCS